LCGHAIGDWHRDADEQDEKQFLAEEAYSGLGVISAGIQMQIALVPNDDVQLVPGSHLRWDTPGLGHNRLESVRHL
jgi:hypothetical protein